MPIEETLEIYFENTLKKFKKDATVNRGLRLEYGPRRKEKSLKNK